MVCFALFRSLGPVRWRWRGWPAGQILGHGQGLSACRSREMAHPTSSQGMKQGRSRQQLGVQAAMGQGPGPHTCGIAGKHIPQSSPGHGRAGLQELPAPPVSGGDDAAGPFQ